MPNPGYPPNNPQYYTPPALYPVIENLIPETCQPGNAEERAVYLKSRDNLKAFLRSQIPEKTEAPERIAEIFAQVPGHQTDESQRKLRRQLSEDARENMLELAIGYHLSGEDMSLGQRVYYILLNKSDSPQAQTENKNIQKIIQNGDPKEIGRLFEACVKRCAGWYEKSFTGISDRELIDNLHELYTAREIVMNADNIRKLMENGRIKISEETRRTLEAMEKNSPWLNSIMQRVRAISNPTYEYIGIDGFLTLSNEQYEQLQETAEEYTGMDDYMRMITMARNDGYLIRLDNKKDLKDSLEAVAKANEGNFIGSFAYSQAFRSLRNVVNFVVNMGDPPNQEALNRMKPMLQKSIERCNKYLQTKDPEAFKNDRERIRYEAMQRALASCEKTLAFHERNPEANLEKQPNAKKSSDTLDWSTRDITQKIDQVYGSESQRFALPASDAGMIADELRADIREKLHKLVTDPENFDPELAQYVKANMVVLEMVKSGRSLNQDGTIAAGPVEKALAADPGGVLESLRGEESTRNAMMGSTLESLKEFIRVGGAADIADSMMKTAEKRIAAANSEPETQLQIKNEGIIPQ